MAGVAFGVAIVDLEIRDQERREDWSYTLLAYYFPDLNSSAESNGERLGDI